MNNIPSWWSEIESIIEARSLLNHPFYQAWQEGRLSIEDLKTYAIRYYPHVAAFPRYVSAVHSNIADLRLRQILLENLIEEERGPESHPELWLRFSEGLGLNRREVVNPEPLNAAAECVRTFLDLSHESDPISGLTALYAYESQIPAVSRTKVQGLQRFYGIKEPRTLDFFNVHEEADVWHAQQEKDAVINMHPSAARQEKAKIAAEKACAAVWRLLDAVTPDSVKACAV